MNIYLYKTKSSDDTISKILTDERKVSITLKGECDILNPYIELTFSKDILGYNYVYMEDFNRYYFITNITSIRNEVWGLNLHIDVLRTYGNRIRAHGAYVTRSASNYNPLIVDDRLPFQNNYKYNYNLQFSKDPFSKFNSSYVPNSYVITLSSDYVPEAPSNSIQRGEIEIYNSLSGLFKNFYLPCNTFKYIINGQDINKIYNILIDPNWQDVLGNLFSEPSDYILDIQQYPFDVYEIMNNFSNQTVIDTDYSNIRIGKYEIQLEDTYRILSTRTEVDCGYVAIPYFDMYGNETAEPNFASYYPYTEMQIYLPFIGIVDIDCYDICGKNIYLKYYINFDDGTCNAVITRGASTNKEIILSVGGSIARVFSLGASNAIQQKRNMVLTAVNLATSIAPRISTISKVSNYSNTSKIYSQPNIRRIQRKTVNTGEGSYNSTSTQYPFIPNISLPSMNYSHGGSPSSTLSTQMYLRPFLIVKNKTVDEQFDLNRYSRYNGLPLESSISLGDLDGYAEIGEIVLQDIRNGDTKATDEEVDEIRSLLANGVRF